MITFREMNEEIRRRNLPGLLTFSNQNPVKCRADWDKRREEIRDILCSQYGGYPPAFEVSTKGETGIREENAFGGKAVREKIILTVRTLYDVFSFSYELYTPKGHAPKSGYPVFVYLGFTKTAGDGLAEEIIDYGYALAHIDYQELAPDRNDGFVSGLGAFCKRNPFDSWGKLGMWGYGASRVLDDLFTRENLDPHRMAVMGHSRLGKAALWCGALDQRFSLVVSNDSGGGGAALFRGKTGEHAANLAAKGSAHWFCGNFSSYAGREEDLPYDQHFLLSMAAPRHLYVASASEDTWADPYSELLACAAAGPAFEQNGVPGLVIPDGGVPMEGAGSAPASGSADVVKGVGGAPASAAADSREPQKPGEIAFSLHEGHIGYHMRIGYHHLGREDWREVIAYREKHGV